MLGWLRVAVNLNDRREGGLVVDYLYLLRIADGGAVDGTRGMVVWYVVWHGGAAIFTGADNY